VRDTLNQNEEQDVTLLSENLPNVIVNQVRLLSGLDILGWEGIISHMFTFQNAYTLHDHTTSTPHVAEVDWKTL